jgi:uncharacterized membrane protein (DUF373 family)
MTDRGPADTVSRMDAARHARPRGYIARGLGRVVDRVASAAIALVVDVLVLLMAIVLVWSVVALGIAIAHTISQRSAGDIKDLVIGVLTIFIVIEIFDLFREYLRSAHIRVTNLAEVSLAVVLRELWLLLLDGSENWQLYSALAAVVVALAVFWWLAMRTAAASVTPGAPFAAGAPEATPGETGEARSPDTTTDPGDDA